MNRNEVFYNMMNGFTSKELFYWLIEKGFFTQAASSRFHGDYEGGLFDHSFEVTMALTEMTGKMGITWGRPESPKIVGMFHDLCKIDAYKLDEHGIAGYVKNDEMTLKGHGDKSIMLLSQFMTLTEEEMLCIRFHMGAYETNDWNEYDKAIKKYETVLWTHSADMFASKVKGV